MWHVIQEPDGSERFVKCIAGQAYGPDGACMHCEICAESEDGCDCWRCQIPRDPNAAPIFDANGEPWAPPDPSELDRLFAADRTEAMRRLVQGLGQEWVRSLPVFYFEDPAPGSFEPTSRLRDEDDDASDAMGEDTDDQIGMGKAEVWFREKIEECE